MNAAEYIKQGLPVLPESLADKYRVVREQAQTHTMRGKQGRVLDSVRPNRPASIAKYVQENIRNISMGEFRMILMKLSRIMKGNDLNVTFEGEKLKEWTKSKPFNLLNDRRELWDWIYEKLLPISLKDPNSVIVPEPYWMGDIPPAAPEELGGIPDNETPKVRVKIVPSSKIRYRESGLLVYDFRKILLKTDKREWEEMIYMIVDKRGFYLAIPKMTSDLKLVYDLQLWFSLPDVYPVHNLPGYRTDDENGENEYLESFAQSFFEYGDEFISSFADNQAVRIQHLSPKYVVDNLVCQAKGCVDGKILMKGGTPKTCTSCNGSGMTLVIDPYAVLQRKDEAPGEAPKTGSRPSIEVVAPPVESIKASFEISFILLQKGKHSVGLELAGREKESAEAKKLRMEDQDDMIQAYSQLLMVCVSGMLASVESILELDPEQRKGVEFQVPHTFMLKTGEQINEEFKTTHISVRRSVFMNLVEAKTHGDPDQKAIYEIALNVCPWLLYTEEELKSRMASGNIDNFQLYLTDHVLQIAARLYVEKDKAPLMLENDIYSPEILAIAKQGFNELEISN